MKKHEQDLQIVCLQIGLSIAMSLKESEFFSLFYEMS